MQRLTDEVIVAKKKIQKKPPALLNQPIAMCCPSIP
jgi:hypothetical protein